MEFESCQCLQKFVISKLVLLFYGEKSGFSSCAERPRLELILLLILLIEKILYTDDQSWICTKMKCFFDI